MHMRIRRIKDEKIGGGGGTASLYGAFAVCHFGRCVMPMPAQSFGCWNGCVR